MSEANNNNDDEKNENENENNTYDVIIIGAGVSGLGAAKALSNANANVLVLEAKDYIGGRICTKDIFRKKVDDNDNDHGEEDNNKDEDVIIKCDIGATWIEDGMSKNNPLMQIINKHNIEYLINDEEDSNGVGYDEISQKIFEYNLLDHYIQLFLDKLDDIKEEIEENNHDKDKTNKSLSVEEATNYFYNQQGFTTNNKNDEFQLQERIATYAIEGRYIGMEYGLTSTKSSLEYFEEDETEGYYTDKKCIFPNGYKQIIDILASNINICLNTPVKSIQYHNNTSHGNKNDILVTTNNNKIYYTKKVIITVSIGVLKSNMIKFEPTLPIDKINALSKLDMGISDKIVLVFNNKFWNTSRIEFIGGDCNESINYYDFTYAYGKPTLVGWFIGGSPMHHKSDEELVDISMKQLSLIFNKSNETNIDTNISTNTVNPQNNLIAYHITRWKEDIYTKGSYSSIPPGGSFNDMSILAENVNDELFFAGEGTNDVYYGYTHGALISGLRAAREINDDAALF